MPAVPERWRPWCYGLGLTMLTAALGVIAYRLMFSTYDVPDDVGYVLMSMKKFDQGESLYSDVYSQYGPGVFVLVGGALRIFGIGLTVETALFTNLFLWLGSVLFIGLALLRFTGRFLVAATGLVLAFVILKVAVNEPLHPGASIAFLLAALLLAAVYLIPWRPRAGMATLGLLAGGLISLKVNVGLFALLSIAFAAVATISVLRRHEIWRVLVTIAFITIPFPLMSENIGDGWALRYAIVVAAGALGLALISTRISGVRRPDGRDAIALGIGVVAILALVSLVPIIGGTSPAELIDGWIVRPAGTADIAKAALPIHSLSWVWVIAGLLLAVGAHRTWNMRRGPWAEAAMGIGRMAAGLMIWISLTGPVFHLPIDLTQGMVVGAPLLWVAALPPRASRSESDAFLRLLVPALAALQFLHAYPMPGSQLNWSVFPLVMVGGVCIADGLDQLASLQLSWKPAASHLLRVAPSLAIVAFAAWLGLKPLRTEARAANARYDESVSLDLPGATRLRVNPLLAEQLQELVAGIKDNCATFLTLPGMNSLNLLSELEPPVELSSPWPFFFTVSEQRRIVEQVRGTPGLCLVHKPDLVAFWGGYFGGEPPRRPLVDYFEKDFRAIHNYSGYILAVPRSPAAAHRG
ncbi:MAG TPA: hypothetical protein VGC49_04515 [Solirubrobacterales bacterium]